MVTTTNRRQQQFQRVGLHVLRVLLFVAIIVLIHVQHLRMSAQATNSSAPPVELPQLLRLFPAAASITKASNNKSGNEVRDTDGKSLGYFLQTSPGSDHVIGFSGPTNVMIAFSAADRIVGIEIISSGDTRDHLNQVREDATFLNSFNGLSWEQAAALPDVDAVSGATLTSFAILESVVFRLSGGRPSLRFPDPLTVDDAKRLFVLADAIKQDPKQKSLWTIKDEQGKKIGSIIRTSPQADNIVGYQGPTETHIGFGSAGKVIGIAIGNSYDNEPYVTYVREDQYFLALFNDLKLKELANLDPDSNRFEGVSGATMTSTAVVESVLLAASQHPLATTAPKRRSVFNWTRRDFGTAAVIAIGLIVAFTSLRGKKRVRIGFQFVLIGYLGLINGDMVSQAMIVGWAQNGVPWTSAGGLVLLTMAAFLVPITTRRNAYCTHLCPHGAAQHLLMHRVPWQLSLPRRLKRTLKLIPAALIVWCVIVAMASLSFSLVDIEPFDAWVFRIAGWATIGIAIVGLVASLFVPMAYCRYGCPTGAVLNFLRFNANSGRWSRRDWFVVVLVGLAVVLWLVC